MLRHRNLSIEREIIRAIEMVDISEIPYCIREVSEFIVPILLPVWPMADRLFGQGDVLVSDLVIIF